RGWPLRETGRRLPPCRRFPASGERWRAPWSVPTAPRAPRSADTEDRAGRIRWPERGPRAPRPRSGCRSRPKPLSCRVRILAALAGGQVDLGDVGAEGEGDRPEIRIA